MNRVARRQRQAASNGCYAFRRGSWPIYDVDLDKWDVYVEAEGVLGPRDLSLTKRQAVGLACAVAKSSKPRIEVTVGSQG